MKLDDCETELQENVLAAKDLGVENVEWISNHTVTLGMAEFRRVFSGREVRKVTSHNSTEYRATHGLHNVEFRATIWRTAEDKKADTITLPKLETA